MSEATATTAELSIDTEHGDDVNVLVIAVWGFVSVVITLISILALYALYNWYVDIQRVDKSYRSVYVNAINQVDRQRASLVAPTRWVDKDAGLVGVPIERAMQLTLDEYKHQEKPQE